MAIGDDLQILLGMVPIRDRAGIARGTMADAAAQAASKPQMDGARPPAFALPPGMMTGAPPAPPADVQLPDDVNAEYTAGRGMSPVRIDPKTPLPAERPVPSERVLASSPAAAPSPAVMRHSDIMFKLYEKQLQQQRMQAIFQSIGGMVSSLQGQPVHGGGAAGGPDMNTVQALLAMRTAEDQATEQLAQKARAIDDYVLTHPHTSREHATTLFEQGQMAGRNSREGLAEEEKLKRTEQARELMLGNIDRAGKLGGVDPVIAKAQIIGSDPADFAKTMNPSALASTASTQQDVITKKLTNAEHVAVLQAWKDAKTDPDAWLAKNPDIKREDLETALASPPAFSKLMLGRAEAAGKLDEAGKVRLAELGESRKPALAAALANSSQIKTLQDLWTEKLKTGGSMSEKVQDIAKIWAVMTGKPLSEARQATELFINQQLAAAIPQAKQLGSNPSNLDLKKSEEVQGGWKTPAQTINTILWLKERSNNAAIEQHNADVARAAALFPGLKNKDLEVPYPEPNRFMRAEVEKRMPGYIANAVRTGTYSDPDVKRAFEKDAHRGVGPGVYDHLVKEELAKQAGR